MPAPFLVQMAIPPEALSAAVRQAGVRTGFHPNDLASVLAQASLASSSLVSWTSSTSALQAERTLVVAVLHALGLAESTANKPSFFQLTSSKEVSVAKLMLDQSCL